MKPLATMIGLTWRAQWKFLTIWFLSLWGLLALLLPYYNFHYPPLAERAVVIQLIENNKAMRVLLGIVPSPGTLGQLIQWETGANLLLISAVMAIFFAVRLTRTPEDAGLTEVLLTQGISPRFLMKLTLGTVSVVSGTFGLGVALICWAQVPFVSELTVSGAFCLGLVIAASTTAFGLVTVILAQLSANAGVTRRAAMLFFGATLLIRAVADNSAASWLNWFSPLGWRQLVGPYDTDRWSVFLVLAVVLLLLLIGSYWLANQREYGHALLSRGGRMRRGRPLRSVGGLAWRLTWPTQRAWLLALIVCAATLGFMVHSFSQIVGSDERTAKMLQQLAGNIETTTAYFLLCGLYISSLIALAVVGIMLRTAGSEQAGLLEVIITNGHRRTSEYRGRLGVSVIAAILPSAVAALSLALSGHLDSPNVTVVEPALRSVLTQVPAVLACLGVASLMVGAGPRYKQLAWVLPAYSIFISLFSPLLEAPKWLQNTSVFAHGSMSGDFPYLAWAVLLGLGGLGILGGYLILQRRDIHS